MILFIIPLGISTLPASSGLKSKKYFISSPSLALTENRTEALLSMSQLGRTLPQVYPQEVKPFSQNGELLYQREEASMLLAEMLLCHSGTRITPICDHCFGAGKTSLVWKFRKVLQNLSETGQWEWPSGSETLKEAVYVHVLFSEDIPSTFILRAYQQDDEQLAYDIDMMLLKRLEAVFRRSLNGIEIDCYSRDAFVSSVSRYASQKYFLIHLDDVGNFEDNGELGKTILYRIWNFGECFRQYGHYYVLTGQSTFLHTIGQSPRRQSQGLYSSPNPGQLVPLPLLNIESVKLMFSEFKLPLPSKEKLDELHLLTGGVPHAVVCAVSCFRSNVEPSLDTLAQTITAKCGRLILDPNDAKFFHVCLELSWTRIHLNDECFILGEPITALIARLGIYREYDSNNSTFYVLKVPVYVLRCHNCTPRSLQSITEYSEKGARLECGFRRVLHLRVLVTPHDSWSALGLPFLDGKVPFPQEELKRSYSFPKIARNHNRTDEEARLCMRQIHDGTQPNYTIFSVANLPCLCGEMKIGQYYQPLSLSKSADAMIRCSRNELVAFQFKNMQEPLSLNELEQEIAKSIVTDWKVYLVVVCLGSREDQDDQIYRENHNGKVILLSRHSIDTFLGLNTRVEFTSTTLL